MKQALLLIFLAGQCFANVPPDDAKLYQIQDFSGGLNTAYPSHKLGDSYSPYMRNVFIDNGKIESINGYVSLGSSRTLAKVTGIFPFVRESGQTTFLVTDSSITLETSDFKTWTFVSSASNTGSLLTWLQVRNKMWGFNGVDFVMTWDGTTKVILNGSGTTPNVPKFKYGANYQDHVFGFSIPNAASDIVFSAVITTDNVIIAPDDSRAWLGNFVLHIGQGDGQNGTALFVYGGRLRAGKERSIFTIYNDNPSSYDPRKEESGIGVVSNESVRVMDSQAHLLSQDGVYRNATRISDLIATDVALFNKGITKILQNSWDSKADFDRGQFAFGSTSTAGGSVTQGFQSLYINYSTNTNFSTLSSTGYTSITQAGGDSAFGVRLSTETIPNNFFGYVGPMILWGGCTNGGVACGQINITFTSTVRNARTGDQATFTNNRDFAAGGMHQIEMYHPTNFQSGPLFTADDLVNSNFTMKVHIDAFSSNVNDVFSFYPATGTGFANVLLYPGTTAQYMSEVSTLSTVTAWGNFNADHTSNGGIVSYFLRTSTSSVNITTQVWQAIAPGAIINAPTINSFIQWASTIQAVLAPTSSTDTATGLNSVTITHIEGQATDARAFAMDWQNRYWLNVTTTSDGTKRLIYVKSIISNTNPDAWMPIEGISVACFAKNGTIFYAGSASTGTVYRLDYGTNYDGVAIPHIYDIPDTVMGDLYRDKNILKYLIDLEKNPGATLSVGSSIDRSTFTTTSFSMDGSGRMVRVHKGVTTHGKTLRIRLSESGLDKYMTINSLGILYQPSTVWE